MRAARAFPTRVINQKAHIFEWRTITNAARAVVFDALPPTYTLLWVFLEAMGGTALKGYLVHRDLGGKRTTLPHEYTTSHKMVFSSHNAEPSVVQCPHHGGNALQSLWSVPLHDLLNKLLKLSVSWLNSFIQENGSPVRPGERPQAV